MSSGVERWNAHWAVIGSPSAVSGLAYIGEFIKIPDLSSASLRFRHDWAGGNINITVKAAVLYSIRRLDVTRDSAAFCMRT